MALDPDDFAPHVGDGGDGDDDVDASDGDHRAGDAAEELVGDDPELLGDVLEDALGLDDGDEVVGLDDRPADIESPESFLDALDEAPSRAELGEDRGAGGSPFEDPSDLVMVDDDEYGWTRDTHATGFGDADEEGVDLDLEPVPMLSADEATGLPAEDALVGADDYDDALAPTIGELPSVRDSAPDGFFDDGPEEPDVELPPLPPLPPRSPAEVDDADRGFDDDGLPDPEEPDE